MEWLGLKHMPTVYAHMRVGTYAYIRHKTNILLLCINRRIYKLYIRFYNVPVFRTSVVVAAVDDVTVAGRAYATTQRYHWLQLFCSWMISSSTWSRGGSKGDQGARPPVKILLHPCRPPPNELYDKAQFTIC